MENALNATGNVMYPLAYPPCLYTYADMIELSSFTTTFHSSVCEVHNQVIVPQIIISIIRCILRKRH